MRVFLLLLVLAAGISSFPPEASAQNRATWRSGTVGAAVTGVSGAVLGTMGSKITFIVATLGCGGGGGTVVYVCTKTSTPTDNLLSYVQSGCV